MGLGKLLLAGIFIFCATACGKSNSPEDTYGACSKEIRLYYAKTVKEHIAKYGSISPEYTQIIKASIENQFQCYL